MEARLIDQQQLVTGTLTSFNGFNFGQDVPYVYGEAKRILNLATSELRLHQSLKQDLQMNPSLPGRPAITGQDDDRVWDFLQIESADESKAFTDCPHLTLGITDRQVEAMVTVPNGIKRAYRRNLINLGQAGFRGVLREILHRMEPLVKDCPGAEPRCSAVQRRYPSQRSVPFVDARLEFDLRTGFDDIGPPKTQPQWIDVLYDCLTNNNSNYQFQVGVWFPYRTCPSIRTAVALEFIADAWIACRPLIDVMLYQRWNFLTLIGFANQIVSDSKLAKEICHVWSHSATR